MYREARDINADGTINRDDFDALEAFVRRGEQRHP